MKNRKLYIDILRILACFAVIVLHTSARVVINETLFKSKYWWIGNIFDSSTRWGVPIFIMITGLLLLPKKCGHMDFKKRILRILIPTIFWGVFYYTYNLFDKNVLNTLSCKNMVKSIISGNTYYHLWYLYSLIGLYLTLPIIKVYINAAEDKNIQYFLIICFIVSSIFPLIEKFLHLNIGIKIPMVGTFLGFFVLGYYLDSIEIKKMYRVVLYILGLICLLITIIGTGKLSTNGKIGDFFYANNSFTTVIVSIAIFVLIKNITLNYNLMNKVNYDFIKQISSKTFGIYLMHAFILGILEKGVLGFKLHATIINPILGIPLTSLIIFMISYIMVSIMARIKYINKLVI